MIDDTIFFENISCKSINKLDESLLEFVNTLSNQNNGLNYYSNENEKVFYYF